MRCLICKFVGVIILASTASAGPVGDAARSGNDAEVERLIQAGVDLNEEDALASPLHFAAMNGHESVVLLLAKAGAAVDAQSSMLGTPLHIAAQRGHSDVIHALIQAGADPNLRDVDGFTALMAAAIQNKPEAARALVQGGADVRASITTTKQTGAIGLGRFNVLHISRLKGHSDVTEILVAAGAGPEAILDPTELMKQADPVKGRAYAYGRCASCHIIEPGDGERSYYNAGPPLHGIFERAVASYPGYEYNDALIEFGGIWTRDRLFTYSLRPMLTVPGTLMYFDDGYTPEDIANVVAYFENWAN